ACTRHGEEATTACTAGGGHIELKNCPGHASRKCVGLFCKIVSALFVIASLSVLWHSRRNAHAISSVPKSQSPNHKGHEGTRRQLPKMPKLPKIAESQNPPTAATFPANASSSQQTSQRLLSPRTQKTRAVSS